MEYTTQEYSLAESMRLSLRPLREMGLGELVDALFDVKDSIRYERDHGITHGPEGTKLREKRRGEIVDYLDNLGRSYSDKDPMRIGGF